LNNFRTVIPSASSGQALNEVKKAFEVVKERHPFTIGAVVLLPDHLHCLWTMPPNDDDFSNRWMLIKGAFTRTCNDPFQTAPSPSRSMKRERTTWQRRFWEHQIRNDDDRKRHTDYIHYNPVKHGSAASPLARRFSSFHRYVKAGIYHPEWGVKDLIHFDKTIGQE